MQLRTICLCVALAAAGHAQAEGKWGLGLGAITATSPYLGESRDFLVVPLVSYEGEDFHFSGVSATYDLYENETLALKAYISPGYDFFDPDDADWQSMKRLKERKFSVMAGFELEADLGFATSTLSAGHDVTGNASGYSLSWGISHHYALAKGLMLIPEIGVVYADAKVVDYYYGVDSGESPYFGAYEADSALNPYASLTLMYQIDKNWQVFSNLEYTKYDSEIKDSPIVGRNGDLQFLAAFSYTF